jgi:uncharacterized protein (DUF1499 family)
VGAIIMLGSIGGVQFGRLSPVEALGGFGVGIALGGLALVLGGGAAVMIWQRGFTGAWLATGGALMALLLLAYPAYGLFEALQLPPLNDVSTDVETPPVFPPRLVRAEIGQVLDAPYPPLFAGEQRAAYPQVQPLAIDLDVTEAYRLALTSVTSLGLDVVAEHFPSQDSNQEGYIAARATSLLLRLIDDVVVRVRPMGEQSSRIDIRSRSRLGRHDLGVNARRVQAITDEITRLADLPDEAN